MNTSFSNNVHCCVAVYIVENWYNKHFIQWMFIKPLQQKRFSEIWQPSVVSSSSISLFVLDNRVIRARDILVTIWLVEPGRIRTVGLDHRSHFIIITAKAAGALLFVCAVAVETVQLTRCVCSEHGAVRNHVLQNRPGFSQPHILGKKTADVGRLSSGSGSIPVMEPGDGGALAS